MAQEVELMGAIYSDVPSVMLPDSNDELHQFTDVTDTTATAADVVEGKSFYDASGTRTNGTASYVSTDDYATDDSYGIVKTNSADGITLDADGRLSVAGRLGQQEGGTGIYAPSTIAPAIVADGSMLLTEASGTTLSSPKSLAVSTGANLSLAQSAAKGATTYRVKNTYQNRIICAGLLIEGGVIARDEASSSFTVPVTDVTIGGSAYIPNSAADSSTPIIITTAASVNPDAAISQIRVYVAGSGFSNLYVGQQVGGAGGASVVVGQKVTNATGNACALIGADIYDNGNGNAVFGRQQISRKNRWLIAGQGHDNTNGVAEAGAVLGSFALISSNTAFAIGNGTSATARSNLLELKTNGDLYINGTKVLP